MADFISYIFDTVFYICENYDTRPQDIVERGLLLLDDDVSCRRSVFDSGAVYGMAVGPSRADRNPDVPLYAGGDQRDRVSGCPDSCLFHRGDSGRPA